LSSRDIPLRDLDLNLLRILEIVLDEGSVGGAASRLGVTPSAVSHALGRLRELLDDPLFVRGAQGMRPTPRALEIGAAIRGGLRQLESALATADFIPEVSRRAFTIVCSAYACAVLLPPLLDLLRGRAPDVQVAVRGWDHEALDDFASGRVDVLIGSFLRIPERCSAVPLLEDPAVWLAGRDYVLAVGDDPADWRASLAHVAAAAADSLTERARTMSSRGFERRLALEECCPVYLGRWRGDVGGCRPQELPHAAVAPVLAQRADLAALVPRRLALLNASAFGLDVIEPGGGRLPRPLELSAVWEPDPLRGRAVGWLIEQLQAAARKSDSCSPGRDEAPSFIGTDGSARGDERAGRSRTLFPAVGHR
jgi:DNA-binding transcriptional LysR family regulator